MTTLEDLLVQTGAVDEEPVDFFLEAARSVAQNLGVEDTLPIDEVYIPAWIYLDSWLFIGAAKNSEQTWIGVKALDANSKDEWKSVLDISGLRTLENFQPGVKFLLSNQFWTDYLKRKLQEVEEPDLILTPEAQVFLGHLAGNQTDLLPLVRQLRYLARDRHTRVAAQWCLQLITQLSDLDPAVMQQILEVIDDAATD